jgi:hypothetical protein
MSKIPLLIISRNVADKIRLGSDRITYTAFVEGVCWGNRIVNADRIDVDTSTVYL